MKALTSAEQALQDFLQFGTLLGGASLFPDQWSSWRQPQARNDNVQLPASYVPLPLPEVSAAPNLQRSATDRDEYAEYVACRNKCLENVGQLRLGKGADTFGLFRRCMHECMEAKGLSYM